MQFWMFWWFGSLPLNSFCQMCFQGRSDIAHRIRSPESIHVAWHADEMTRVMRDGSDMLILPAVVINVHINSTIPSIPIWYLLTRVVWVVDLGIITIQ